MEEKSKKLEQEGGEKIKEIKEAEGAKMKSVGQTFNYSLKAKEVMGLS